MIKKPNSWATFFEFKRPAYLFLSIFIFVSGLSLTWVNLPFLLGTISLIRIGWIILFLYLVVGLLNRSFELGVPIFLISIWGFIHLISLVVGHGHSELIITRIFQSFVIIALVASLFAKNFKLRSFCLNFSPNLSFIAITVTFIYVFVSQENANLGHIIRSSIIGVSSNFSIFCTQLIAVFILRHLYLYKKEHPTSIVELFT